MSSGDNALAAPSAIGANINVVAVLEIHIEMTAEPSMKHPTRGMGRPRANEAMDKAIRSCSRQRSTAAARMNPPMKRKMMGSAYGAAASLTDAAPSSGRNAKGSKAVAAIGIASVTHQTTMSAASDTTHQASGVSPSGGAKPCTASASAGPNTRPTLRPTSPSEPVSSAPELIKEFSLPALSRCQQRAERDKLRPGLVPLGLGSRIVHDPAADIPARLIIAHLQGSNHHTELGIAIGLDPAQDPTV